MTTTIIALIAIAIICAAFMAWHHFERAVENMTMPEPKTPAPDDDSQDRADHRARLAAYNDTEHLADMEFYRLRGKANLYELIANSNGVNTDEYRRRLNAGMTNYRAASMEPFCGEGKEP